MTRPSYQGILWQYRTILIFLISPNTTPNEINMQNSVIQAFLPCMHLLKECMIYNFTQMIHISVFGAC